MPSQDEAYAKPPVVGENVLAQYKLSDAEKLMLGNAVNSPSRIDKNRDIARHPFETLDFFGLKSNSKIVEIWPGQGWYSTVLADYLRQGGGEFVAAQFDTSTTNSPLVKEVVDNYTKSFGNNSQKFGRVSVVPFGPRSKELGEKESVDAVLTFRNIHNWLSQGWAEKAFDDFYKVLKPGGILGIEEHRAGEDSPQDPIAADGYVREDYVIDLAKEAGFVLIKSSEINANPKDTKDHPFGVWTLPPVGRTAPYGKPPNPSFDQSKYKEIGESDRMTLLFMKPFPPPPKMAKVKEKDTKSTNPLDVIFGKKPVAPPIIVAQKPKPVENKYNIVFEPVNVAYVPASDSKPPSNVEKPLNPPNGEKVDFSSDKPSTDLPDFTIPAWGDNPKPADKKEVKAPVKTPNKVASKTEIKADQKPDAKKATVATPKSKTSDKVASSKKPDAKTVKKDNVNSKKPSTKSKETASKAKAPPAKTNAASKTSKAPVKKTSDAPKATSKTTKKPATTTSKKDSSVPDWSVKPKKKK